MLHANVYHYAALATLAALAGGASGTKDATSQRNV